MITGAPDCIYKTIILITMLFLKKTNPNFHEIYQISGTLLAPDIGYSATRKHIHCCLTISQPSLDI